LPRHFFVSANGHRKQRRDLFNADHARFLARFIRATRTAMDAPFSFAGLSIRADLAIRDRIWLKGRSRPPNTPKLRPPSIM